MLDVRGSGPQFTRHALETIRAKGFDMGDVRAAFDRPNRIYPSGSHPGQFRICGHGLALVGEPNGDGFTVITVYRDGIVTAVRPDQLATAAGRRFASIGRQ